MSYFLCDEFKDMEPYVPGEQPKDRTYIKLNANESAFPPSPEILKALTLSDVNGMGYYSDPHCKSLKQAIAETYNVSEDMVFVGNGADEVLGFCFMSFFSNRMRLCAPDVTYDFYRTYAKTYRIDYKQFPLNDDLTVNVEDYINTDRDVILANPNNPTGLVIPVKDMERIIAARPDRMVIVDEAYVDYGNESCIPLVEKYENLIVVQTFSKSRNMAGARIGYAISNKEIIQDMNTIKFTFNPFNMSEFALKFGAAVMRDKEYLETCVGTILMNREWTKAKLEKLGFTVMPSRTNFLMFTRPDINAKELTAKLKENGILVRHYGDSRIDHYIRMTIGTIEQMREVIDTLDKILGGSVVENRYL